MKKEIQNLYISLCVKVAIYINAENFLLTPAIFSLIVLNIVDEIETFSLNNVKLNGTEKRNLASALTEMLLKDLLKKEKIDHEIYNQFTSPDPEIFAEAKTRWCNTRGEEKNSCSIF